MIDLPRDGRVVVLIDADNISSCQEIDLVLKQLKSYEGFILKRAYGDWFADNMKGWKSVLNEYEIEPVHSLVTSTSGKNATDIRLVIDAMDLLHSQKIDCFCIVSSDRDFTPLVRRLKQSGIKVIGFGRKNSASILRNAYHQFISLDQLVTPDPSITSQPTLEVIAQTANNSTKQSSNNKQTASKPFKQELLEIAKAAYEKVNPNGSWTTIGQIEPHLKKLCQQKLQQTFSCKLFGCKSLVKLVNEVGIFEWDAKQPSSTKTQNKKIKLKQAN